VTLTPDKPRLRNGKKSSGRGEPGSEYALDFVTHESRARKGRQSGFAKRGITIRRVDPRRPLELLGANQGRINGKACRSDKRMPMFSRTQKSALGGKRL